MTHSANQFIRRAWRAQRGSTSVELALVSFPFFLLFLALIEIGMIFFANLTLDIAVSDAARDIRTGEVQNGGGQSQFETAVCDRIKIFMSCGGELHFDVRTFEDFDDVDLTDPNDGDGVDTSGFGFDPGEERDVVMVRVFYEWKIITPLIGEYGHFANMSGNRRLLTSTAAFRNEPFGEIELGG